MNGTLYLTLKTGPKLIDFEIVHDADSNDLSTAHRAIIFSKRAKETGDTKFICANIPKWKAWLLGL